jgi:hypothetical protein
LASFIHVGSLDDNRIRHPLADDADQQKWNAGFSDHALLCFEVQALCTRSRRSERGRATHAAPTTVTIGPDRVPQHLGHPPHSSWLVLYLAILRVSVVEGDSTWMPSPALRRVVMCRTTIPVLGVGRRSEPNSGRGSG